MELEDAKEGTKVRCIDGHFKNRSRDPGRVEEMTLPVEGGTYTIREVVEAAADGWGLRLNEIRNQPIRYDIGGLQEPCFYLRRFEVAA